MSKTFVIANQKGGIGKTTTATTLAGILSKKGKTLLIDADQQCNSTSTYQAQIDDCPTLYDVVIDSDHLPLDEAIQHMPNGDIVASDPLLAKSEKMLDGDIDGLYHLQDAINELSGYDYIVIDTAPSLSVILYNCLIAADEVIIPVQAAYLPIKGLEQLLKTISRVKRKMNPNLNIMGILLTMVDYRTNYANEITDVLYQVYGNSIHIFENVIPMSVRAAESPAEGVSIYTHDGKGKVALAYEALTKEVANNG